MLYPDIPSPNKFRIELFPHLDFFRGGVLFIKCGWPQIDSSLGDNGSLANVASPGCVITIMTATGTWLQEFLDLCHYVCTIDHVSLSKLLEKCHVYRVIKTKYLSVNC